VAATGALLVCGCAGRLHRPTPVAPEQAGAAAWDRLARLSSFGFELEYHTDAPFPIAAGFRGARERADRELWSGFWRRRGEVTRVELRASGADQYEREGRTWRRTQRGIETRILEQGQLALRGNPLDYAGTEHGRHRYRFSCGLPVLDPTQTKKLTGFMEVDERSGLPVRLYCSDSSRAAEWEMRLGRFNRAGPVRVPFLPATKVEAFAAGRMGRFEYERTLAILKQRLAALAWEHRLSRKGHGFLLQLSQSRPMRQMAMLFSRGGVEVWLGRSVSPGELPDSGSVVEVGGDAARRFALVRPLGANAELKAGVTADNPLAVAIECTTTLSDTGGTALLVVNGHALSTAGPGKNGRLRFPDVGTEDEARLVAAVASSEPLPAVLEVRVRQ
jgi:hypothetical protein